MVAFFLLGLVIVLFIPFLIVGFWRKRPVWAFIVAAIVAFLSLAAPSLIKTYQAVLIYGKGDPQLMAGGISEAIVGALLGLIVVLPILALFQFFIRWLGKRKNKQPDIDQTFS